MLCNVVLVSAAQQSESARCPLYMYTLFFLDFLLIQVTTVHQVEILVLYSRFSLVIYFIRDINSQLIVERIEWGLYFY